MLGALIRGRVIQPQVARQILRTYMDGPYGRYANNRKIQGMTWATLKKHPPIVILAFVMGCTTTFIVSYLLRLAFFTTDVNWTKQTEWSKQPMEYYRNRRFKFMDPLGVADYKCQAPIYEFESDKKQ